MKRFFFYACLLGIVISFFSCEKEQEPELGSIYGVVTDLTTGEPVKNVGVELLPLNLKSITGSDGSYEFVELAKGKYQIHATKAGYKDYTSSPLDVASTKVSHNIHLELLPPALTVVDGNGIEIDSINFGSDDGIIMKSFNIFNDSDEKLKWSITYQCNWIKSFSEEKGEINANQTQALVLTIERANLNLGENSTIVHITSNNGSKQLIITAISQSVVETKEVTDIGGQAAALNAKIVRDLNPSISEYGFVYSTSPAPSLTNGATKISQNGTPQIGTYYMLVEGLSHNTKYYVRAFVSNSQNIVYGEQVVFTTLSARKPTIEITSCRSPFEPTSATIGFKVTSDGGLPLEEVGICWADHSVVTKEDNFLVTGNEVKNYTQTITGLEPNKLYYIRAYAQNADCIEYSQEYSGTTKDGKPEVETYNDYSSGIDYITISGYAKTPEIAPITRQGICYSTTSQSPTTYDNIVLANNNVSPFTCTLTGLNSGTTYYCRAFAENEYGLEYGITKTISTIFADAHLVGYVRDQDGNPIAGATITGYDTNTSTATTDNNGYYSLSLGNRLSGKYQFSANATSFSSQIKEISIRRGQENQLDFTLTISNPISVDFGTGTFSSMGQYWQMLFSCSQSSLAGSTTTKNMRIKNNRSIPLSYSITNLPTTGINFSATSGTIPANSIVSITVTFTYPTTSSQQVRLSGCSTGNRAYVWNWEGVLGGYYADQNGAPNESSCAALCYQTPVITVGDQSEAFDLIFNQYVTY